jgi:hypothetical protein
MSTMTICETEEGPGELDLIITAEHTSWFRKLMGWAPDVEMYIGWGSVWQTYPAGRRVSSRIAAQLGEHWRIYRIDNPPF